MSLTTFLLLSQFAGKDRLHCWPCNGSRQLFKSMRRACFNAAHTSVKQGRGSVETVALILLNKSSVDFLFKGINVLACQGPEPDFLLYWGLTLRAAYYKFNNTTTTATTKRIYILQDAVSGNSKQSILNKIAAMQLTNTQSGLQKTFNIFFHSTKSFKQLHI